MASKHGWKHSNKPAEQNRRNRHTLVRPRCSKRGVASSRRKPRPQRRLKHQRTRQPWPPAPNCWADAALAGVPEEYMASLISALYAQLNGEQAPSELFRLRLALRHGLPRRGQLETRQNMANKTTNCEGEAKAPTRGCSAGSAGEQSRKAPKLAEKQAQEPVTDTEHQAEETQLEPGSSEMETIPYRRPVQKEPEKHPGHDRCASRPESGRATQQPSQLGSPI